MTAKKNRTNLQTTAAWTGAGLGSAQLCKTAETVCKNIKIRSCTCLRCRNNYENQTGDEQFAEIEAAQEAEGVTMMAVQTELVPAVRALLARRQSA